MPEFCITSKDSESIYEPLVSFFPSDLIKIFPPTLTSCAKTRPYILEYKYRFGFPSIVTGFNVPFQSIFSSP